MPDFPKLTSKFVAQIVGRVVGGLILTLPEKHIPENNVNLISKFFFLEIWSIKIRKIECRDFFKIYQKVYFKFCTLFDEIKRGTTPTSYRFVVLFWSGPCKEHGVNLWQMMWQLLELALLLDDAVVAGCVSWSKILTVWVGASVA